MAATNTTLAPDPVGTTIVSNTNIGTTIVYGSTSACNMYLIHIDNSGNTSTAAYLRIVDAASNVSTNTTDDYRFYAPAGETATYVCEVGMPMATGLAYWCTTSAADQNATAPTNPVSIKILI